jgi:hypothetical protein
MFVAFAAIVAVVAVLGHLQEKKRREALQATAASLGLGYRPEKDRDLPSRYRFLDKMRTGSNRYASNLFAGTYKAFDINAFDFHYETHSTDSKGHRRTHHHHLAYYVLGLPRAFPEVTIGPESFLSKIAQAVGFDDIDFESHEFSRTFCVRSKDKKLAYDVCNARMIEYLLANPDLTIELEEDILALVFNGKMKPEDVGPRLDRLVAVRERIPNYLFAS